jgi:glycyl-tRNA synthetase beta subunit
MPLSAELITIGLSAIAAIVWLVRLEGRVNTAEKVAAAMDRDLAATNARAEAEAKAHRGTADALIRVEEQLKYVRELLERHFVIEEPAPRRRRTGGSGS